MLNLSLVSAACGFVHLRR